MRHLIQGGYPKFIVCGTNTVFRWNELTVSTNISEVTCPYCREIWKKQQDKAKLLKKLNMK